MITLRHSSLQVPEGPDTPRVTGLKEYPTADDVLFTAAVSVGSRRIGTLDYKGNGGSTTFHPDAPGDLQTWLSFVDSARLSDPGLGHHDVVASALVNEFRTDRTIKRLRAKGGTLARGLQSDGGTRYEARICVPAAQAWKDPDVIADLLSTKTRDWEGVITWQVWDGDSWRTLGTSGTPYTEWDDND